MASLSFASNLAFAVCDKKKIRIALAVPNNPARSWDMSFKMLGWNMPALRTRALSFKTGPSSHVCLGVVLMNGDDDCLGAVAFKSLLRKFAALD